MCNTSGLPDDRSRPVGVPRTMSNALLRPATTPLEVCAIVFLWSMVVERVPAEPVSSKSSGCQEVFLVVSATRVRGVEGG